MDYDSLCMSKRYTRAIAAVNGIFFHRHSVSASLFATANVVFFVKMLCYRKNN